MQNWLWPQDKLEGELWQRLLVRRGFADAKAQEEFLAPGLNQIIPHTKLHDSAAAAELILQTAAAGKRIYIHGDYDVDGVCATALLWDFLFRQLGADVVPFIPNRFTDGYGLSEQSLEMMVQDGAGLVITVDCGIRDAKLVKKFRKLGLEFVITDHHSLETNAKGKVVLPDCVVVHPKHPQGEYPFTEICGTTVAWKLTMAIATTANMDWDINHYVDLVAMATVCDVMPLISENRAIVALGLGQLRRWQRPGIKALLDVAAVNTADLKAYHFGFNLGPRLNAAGRLDSAMAALRLLSTRNAASANSHAQELNELNQRRQQLTIDLLETAEAQLLEQLEKRLLFVHGEDWPEGVVGLIAGKLTEKYHRPVLAASVSKDGLVKGSARSIEKFHITDALSKVSDLLESFGGHAQAAGFSLQRENLDDFISQLAQIAQESLSESDLVRNLRLDETAELSELTVSSAKQIDQLEPFGFGNPRPVIGIRNAKLSRKRIFGKENQHIGLFLADREGNELEALAFSMAKRWSDLPDGIQIHVAVNLGVDAWQGRERVQLFLKDVQVSE